MRPLFLLLALTILAGAAPAAAGALDDCAASGDRGFCLESAAAVAERDLAVAEAAARAAAAGQPDAAARIGGLAGTFRGYRQDLCGLSRSSAARPWDADAAAIACMADLTRAHARALVAAAGVAHDDPVAYCRAAGTIDAPDVRYVGPLVPDWMAAAVRARLGAPDYLPLDAYRATAWRCADGAVLACAPGANLPCGEKADADRTPRESLRAFCRANPDSEFAPMAVTGRATLYDWRCRAGAPAIVGDRAEADKQGFIANVWFAVAPAAGDRTIGRDAAASGFAATRDGDVTVTAIRNVAYRVAGAGIAGLGADDRLVLRETVGAVQALDEKGARALGASIEAWRLGSDLAGPPLYRIDEPGEAVELALNDFVVIAGENTDWPYPPKTAFALGSGRRVFAATTPWQRFYLTSAGAESRYVAFASANAEQTARDAEDAPTLVGVLTYAGRAAALQRLRVVAATEEQARFLRAVEETPEIALVGPDGQAVKPFDTIDVAADSAVRLHLRFPFNGLDLVVPLRADRLDGAGATLPAGLTLQPLN
ncbi:MAG: hypothetical protein AB7F67_08315 [Rhodospirillaceae bacterium]